MDPNSNIKLNLHKSPADTRDFHVRVSTKTPLNSSTVDLSNYCTTVKNQGYVGSCTAFATVGLMEYVYKKASGDDTKNDIYSERFTYYTTRVDQLGWPATDDSGAYLRSSIASVVKQGAAPENNFPYYKGNVIDFSEKPSPQTYQAAETNQVVVYARVDDDNLGRDQVLQECLHLLDIGHPFVGGFICYDSLWNENVSQSGIIPPPGGNIIGGHAVLFVGYNNDKKLFKFKNSWGPNWGYGGYGYLPYEYLLRGEMWDLWTILKQENFSNTDFLHIDKPDKKDESHETEEDNKCRKEWGKIVKKIQDITSDRTQDQKLQELLKNTIRSISDLGTEIQMYKNSVNDKLKSLQIDIINIYDLMN